MLRMLGFQWTILYINTLVEEPRTNVFLSEHVRFCEALESLRGLLIFGTIVNEAMYSFYNLRRQADVLQRSIERNHFRSKQVELIDLELLLTLLFLVLRNLYRL